MFQFKTHLILIFFIIGLCSCQSLKQEDELIDEVPGDGLLGAKLMALNDAMDNLSDDDRKFGTS